MPLPPPLDDIDEVELSLDEGEVKYLMRRSRSMGVSVLERLTASILEAVMSSNACCCCCGCCCCCCCFTRTLLLDKLPLPLLLTFVSVVEVVVVLGEEVVDEDSIDETVRSLIFSLLFEETLI